MRQSRAFALELHHAAREALSAAQRSSSPSAGRTHSPGLITGQAVMAAGSKSVHRIVRSSPFPSRTISHRAHPSWAVSRCISSGGRRVEQTANRVVYRRHQSGDGVLHGVGEILVGSRSFPQVRYNIIEECNWSTKQKISAGRLEGNSDLKWAMASSGCRAS